MWRRFANSHRENRHRLKQSVGRQQFHAGLLDVLALEKRQFEPAFLIERGVGPIAGLTEAVGIEGHDFERVVQQRTRLTEFRFLQTLGLPPLALFQLKQEREQDIATQVGNGGSKDSLYRGIGNGKIDRPGHGLRA